MKYEIPQDWQNFIQKLEKKLLALPITWALRKVNLFDRKDDKGRIIRWQEYGLSEGQQRAVRFWLLIEILEILTRLPGGRIVDHPAEFSEWPELSKVEADKWDQVTDLIFTVCRGNDNSEPVKRIVSFFEQKQDGIKGNYGQHQENREWVEKNWKIERKKLPSDNQTDEKIQEMYKEKFKGTSISKSHIQRFTGRQ